MLDDNIAAYCNDAFYAIGGVFLNAKEPTQYTFFILKRLQETLSIGDIVVADTSKGLALIEVTELDAEYAVDIQVRFKYSWVFDKVYTEVRESIRDVIDIAVLHIRQNRKENLKRQLGISQEIMILETSIAEGNT